MFYSTIMRRAICWTFLDFQDGNVLQDWLWKNQLQLGFRLHHLANWQRSHQLTRRRPPLPLGARAPLKSTKTSSGLAWASWEVQTHCWSVNHHLFSDTSSYIYIFYSVKLYIFYERKLNSSQNNFGVGSFFTLWIHAQNPLILCDFVQIYFLVF